jgi:hypothetical protein
MPTLILGKTCRYCVTCDLHADDSHGFAERAAHQLVRYTTPLERQTIAESIRKLLADKEEVITGSPF